MTVPPFASIARLSASLPLPPSRPFKIVKVTDSETVNALIVCAAFASGTIFTFTIFLFKSSVRSLPTEIVFDSPQFFSTFTVSPSPAAANASSSVSYALPFTSATPATASFKASRIENSLTPKVNFAVFSLSSVLSWISTSESSVMTSSWICRIFVSSRFSAVSLSTAFFLN